MSSVWVLMIMAALACHTFANSIDSTNRIAAILNDNLPNSLQDKADAIETVLRLLSDIDLPSICQAVMMDPETEMNSVDDIIALAAKDQHIPYIPEKYTEDSLFPADLQKRMDELVKPVRERALAGISKKENKKETISPVLIERVKNLKSNLSLSAEERRLDDVESSLKRFPTDDYIEMKKDHPERTTERPEKQTLIMSDETLTPQFNTESFKEKVSESTQSYITSGRSTEADTQSYTSSQISADSEIQNYKSSETSTFTEPNNNINPEISSVTDTQSYSTPEASTVTETQDNTTPERSTSADTQKYTSSVLSVDTENTTDDADIQTRVHAHGTVNITKDFASTTKSPVASSSEVSSTVNSEFTIDLNQINESIADVLDNVTTVRYRATTSDDNKESEDVTAADVSAENKTETVVIRTLSHDLLSKSKNIMSESLQRISNELNTSESDVMGLEEELAEEIKTSTEEPKREHVWNLTTENEIETTTSPIIVDDYESVDMLNEYTTNEGADFSTQTSDMRSNVTDGQGILSSEENTTTSVFGDLSTTSNPLTENTENSTFSSEQENVTTVIVDVTSHATTTSMEDKTQYNLLGHLLNLHRSSQNSRIAASTTSAPSSVQPGDLFTLPTVHTTEKELTQTTLSPIQQFLKLINDTFELAEKNNLTDPYYDVDEAPYDDNAVQYATKSLADLISQTEDDFTASNHFPDKESILNEVSVDEALNSINTDGTLDELPYYHIQKDNFFHIGEERDPKNDYSEQTHKGQIIKEEHNEEEHEEKTPDSEKKEQTKTEDVSKEDKKNDDSSNLISSLDYYNKLYEKTREVLNKAFEVNNQDIYDKQFYTSATTTTAATTITTDPVLRRLFKPKQEKPYDISDFQKYQKPADSVFMAAPDTRHPVHTKHYNSNPFVSYPEPSVWRIPQEGPYRGKVENQYYNPVYGGVHSRKSGWLGMNRVHRNRFDESSASLASLGIKQHTVAAQKPPRTSVYKNERTVCSGLFGYYADPSDCRAFFICSWGIPYRFYCPHGTLWNSGEGVCDWTLNVDCLSK